MTTIDYNDLATDLPPRRVAGRFDLLRQPLHLPIDHIRHRRARPRPVRGWTR